MRYLTGVIRPVEKVHPVEETLAGTPEVTPVALHQTKLVDDGTCITLLEVRGDLDRLAVILSEHPAVLEFAVSGARDGFVYLQTEPNDLTRSLSGLQDTAELIVRMPMEHTDDGGLRGTLVGDDAAFRGLAEMLPDELDLEVERIGDYHSGIGDVFSTLTDRQQEVLSAALREGYYEDPRRISQTELAGTLGIAPGTLSQHLRRIEAKVFATFVPVSGDGDRG